MAKFTDIPPDIGALISDHARLYLEDPVRAQMWDARPVGLPGLVTTLLLTTKGRKSGQERHAPLLYVDDDGGYLTIGSKGGAARHPVWYLNLLDDPECEIRVGALRTKARARTLEGAERDAAWRKVTALHDVFLKYQARTERPIPVIKLEPISA